MSVVEYISTVQIYRLRRSCRLHIFTRSAPALIYTVNSTYFILFFKSNLGALVYFFVSDRMTNAAEFLGSLWASQPSAGFYDASEIDESVDAIATDARSNDDVTDSQLYQAAECAEAEYEHHLWGDTTDMEIMSADITIEQGKYLFLWLLY